MNFLNSAYISDSLYPILCRSLNSNSFSGRIPPSIGNLLNLYWLDLADNKLSGKIPVSTQSTPGLDMLVNTKHLYVYLCSLTLFSILSEIIFSKGLTKFPPFAAISDRISYQAKYHLSFLAQTWAWYICMFQTTCCLNFYYKSL